MLELIHGFNSSAAAFAAITNCVEAVQHNILEPCRVHMTSLMFQPQKLEGFRLAQAAAFFSVVIKREIRKKLANDHTYLRRLTTVASGCYGRHIRRRSHREVHSGPGYGQSGRE